MKAMILAAGLGTRLRPLTNDRPKALVEINGRTLLEITIARLKGFGVTEIIVNVHHHADQITDYLKSQNNFGLRIEISHEEVLLDTGGGLKKAAWFFLENPAQLDDPFLLHNVDVISTIDLAAMLQFHKTNNALATLAVQNRQTSRYLLFNEQMQLIGRRAGSDGTPELVRSSPGTPVYPELRRAGAPQPTPQRAPSTAAAHVHAFAFSGIHVISPRLLPMLNEEGIFSIIPAYLRLASQNEKILAFRADQYHWRDLGRPDDLNQAALELRQGILR